jgi:cellulose synthase/poly-beta-1,6-N-acetylglucosamine synthase-like glycosyltransferase
MEKLGSNAQPSRDRDTPRLSVIVPVRDGSGFLADSLPALRASDLRADEWELIVVDDGSTDASADVAGRYADAVVRLSRPHGPALARNRGAERARGEILVFIDADVSVHRGVLRGFSEIFAREPDVAAAFGAYDASPRAPGLVSQYRNLLHHRVHAENRGDAETFWTGCGAIRREVFAETGGFDETAQPIEDIELGYRARALGHRIALRPEIQGTHLKRWTLGSMVRTDLFGRGVTWMRLHLEQRGGGRPGTLNLGPAEKLYTLLTGLAAVAMGIAAVRRQPAWLLASVAGLLVVLVGNMPLFLWFGRVRGPWFALGVVPLRVLYYALNAIAAPIGWLRHTLSPRKRLRDP